MWQNCIELNTYSHGGVQEKLGKSEYVLWSVIYAVSWLWYYSFTECRQWGKLGKVYKGSPCVVSYNYMRIWASQVALVVKNPPCRKRKKHGFDPWVRKISWRRDWQPIPVTLAWRIPWTEEPGGLQSTGLQRVRHDWSNPAQAHM